jgi:uncharacterized membrane protein YfcA
MIQDSWFLMTELLMVRKSSPPHVLTTIKLFQTGIIAFAVQLYFAFRISVLTRHNWFILVPLGICIILGLGGSVALVSDGAHNFFSS